MASGSDFMQAAKACRVGFGSPPCTDISSVNRNRDESSACAELTVDCVRKLAEVQHEMFCMETVTNVASARGGHLLASIYAASDEAGYIPQLFCLDPLRLGGHQSRCRAYMFFTRKDVHAARGPFVPPAAYQVLGTPTSVRHLLDPVSDVPPAEQYPHSAPTWTPVDVDRDPSHRGPQLLFLSGSKNRRMRCYSIDSPAACLTTNTSWIFDPRPGVDRCRRYTTAELLRIQGLPACLVDDLPPTIAHQYIGLGTEGICMRTVGTAIADYLGVEPDTTPATTPAARNRGRLPDNKPAAHHKQMRHDSFAGVCLKIANGRMGFCTPAKMRMYGFRVSDNFFVPIAAMARGRHKQREHTGREVTPRVAVCDWKGRFCAAKGGGATSVIGFRHPTSGYVHEEYVTDQTVATAVKAFVSYRDFMRVRFNVTIDTLWFDRDPAFNRDFRDQLRALDVDSDMSGAYDHWELGAIETYWDTWQSLLAAFLLHGNKDETYWRFAGGMANYVMNRSPTSANPGHISPIEYLTNEVPNLTNLRVPFSPSYVVQHDTGSLQPRAKAGVFVGYPTDTRNGIWCTYMPDTKTIQTSRHTVFDEHYHFPEADETPEERAKRVSDLAHRIAQLESSAARATKTVPPTVVADAIADDHYMVCNPATIDRATAYIRDRCITNHGRRIRSQVIGTFYKQGKKRVRYTAGTVAYDKRCSWITTSPTPPLPFANVPFAAPIFSGQPHLRSTGATARSYVERASHAGIDPVADDNLLPFPQPSPPMAPPPPITAERLLHGLSTLDSDVFSRMSTADRTAIAGYMHQHRNPTVAAVLELPTAEQLTFVLVPGEGPSLDDLAAPTMPGPPSYKAAMSTPEWRKWLQVIHDEVDGQAAAGCWHWELLPPGATLLRNVLVLTQKLHADFTVDKLKARICVDGSCEKAGEYSDICALIAQLSTFKTQMAACAELEGKCYSGDFKQAYLKANNTAVQYMREPEAMKPKYDSWGRRLFLRITRALYGGKGSAGLWDSCADLWHTNYGFQRSLADPRLYYLTRGRARISMVLATDDTSICVPHEKHFPGSHALYLDYIDAIQTDFKSHDGTEGFVAKGLTKEFIGVGVDQSQPGKIILDMRAVATNIVKSTGFVDSHLAAAPGVPHTVLSELDCAAADDTEAPDKTAYRSRVGKMLWISRGTLPAFQYHVSALARMNHAPGRVHWNASSDALRWLATASDARIVYQRTGEPLFYYVDSDFLPDYGTRFDNRRSTTGYCAFFAGACVNHVSRRQTTVATSTAHAEYLAAFDAARDALRLRILLADLGLPQVGTTTMFEDNATCIKMTDSTASTPRMQHLDARYHWLREQVVHDKLLRFVYCKSADMVADALTKPLSGPEVKRFHGAFSGFNPIPHPPFGGPHGRIGASLQDPDSFPLLSDV